MDTLHFLCGLSCSVKPYGISHGRKCRYILSKPENTNIITISNNNSNNNNKNKKRFREHMHNFMVLGRLHMSLSNPELSTSI